MTRPVNPADGTLYPSTNPTEISATVNGIKVWNRYILGAVAAGTGPVTVNAGVVNVDALSTAAATAADVANATAAAAALTQAQVAFAAAAGKAASIVRVGNDIRQLDAAGTVLASVSLGDLGVDISADTISIDGNFLLTINQTNGGPAKTIDLRTLKSINTTGSLTGNGDGLPVQLFGDAAAPGNDKHYGTGPDGSKGWQTNKRIPKTWGIAPLGAPDGTATVDDKWIVGATTYLPVPNAAGTGLDWVQ